jgi:hypothetical protein
VSDVSETASETSDTYSTMTRLIARGDFIVHLSSILIGSQHGCCKLILMSMLTEQTNRAEAAVIFNFVMILLLMMIIIITIMISIKIINILKVKKAKFSLYLGN